MPVYALLDICAKVFSSLCSGPSYSHCWELCKAPRYWELCSAHTTNLCECRPAASLLSLGGHCLVPLQAYPRSWGCGRPIAIGMYMWQGFGGIVQVARCTIQIAFACSIVLVKTNCIAACFGQPWFAKAATWHPDSATAVIKPAWLAQAQTRTAKRCHNEQCAQP